MSKCKCKCKEVCVTELRHTNAVQEPVTHTHCVKCIEDIEGHYFDKGGIYASGQVWLPDDYLRMFPSGKPILAVLFVRDMTGNIQSFTEQSDIDKFEVLVR